MKHYIGLDVSMKETSICIIDEQGKVVKEGIEFSDPVRISEYIKKTQLTIEKVALESGCLSHWLLANLQQLGIPAICVDARKMSAVLSLNVNKTDQNDARGIADALRCNYYREVSLKAQNLVEIGTFLSARRALIGQRTTLKNIIRGLLKSYGIRLTTGNKMSFSDAVRASAKEQATLVQTSIEALLTALTVLESEIKKMDKQLKDMAKVDSDAQLLMTIPGVGVITALSFKVAIGDPRRFKNSRSVGAYLGMTPKQYSSGEIQKQGRISKCGSSEMRSLLFESAVVLLTRTKVWCQPKAWALKILRKKGLKKAACALARKLAVIMHRIMITREPFRLCDTKEKTEEVQKCKAA